MNYQTRIKRFLLAGVLAFSLLLGTLNVAGRIHASTIATQVAAGSGTCWKCT